MHCKVTGKAQGGILHFIQQTPFKWHAKLQDTVENATFGSELNTCRIAVDQIIGNRATLMALGVPIETSTWLLGDNQSVITQCTVPTSTLTKRHNALAYHRVRWVIAAGIVKFVKIAGKENVADALTKFLPYADAWPLLKPVLFWVGETMDRDEVLFYLQDPALPFGEPTPGESFTIVPGPALTQGECQNDGAVAGRSA